MRTYIFACVHNAGRSQMSAAFFNRFADPQRAHAVSAGTQPATQVHATVVETMRELGIDLSSAVPQMLTGKLAAGAEMLITMGCGEACPYVSGLRREDWLLSDPKNLPIAEVRALRDDIQSHILELVQREQLSIE